MSVQKVIRLSVAGDESDVVAAETPTLRLRLTETLIQLVSRASAMGLVSSEPESLDQVLDALEEHSIGNVSVARIRSAIERRNLLAVVDEVDTIVALLDDSPVPQLEWHSAGRLLGHELVERMTAVSSSARRRYETGERATPDGTSARLHFIAMVNADLLGSYNEFGVRRWYVRPRSALRGRSPADVLDGDWTPSDEEPSRVRQLAAALTAPSAT